MKIRKGSKVTLDGKVGKFDFVIQTVAGKIAYVDFKVSNGVEYFKICFFDELKFKPPIK